MKNKQQLIENPEKGSKRQNREMAVVTYLVMAIFFILAGYMVYFIIHDSDQVLNNSANKRQELLAKRVTKGKILSDKGNVLAKTVTDSSGNETRKYPYGSLFAHVVGRSSHGKTGLEASESYTMLTSGLNPFLSTINELKGKKNPGNNVVTTLNVELSKAASNALGSKRGAVVVMDPETGKILAMVSKPSYDPNQLTDARWNKLTSDSGEQSALYNRATQGLYPPGSTFKILTTLEYMNENSNYNEYSFQCNGKLNVDNSEIHCFGGEVHGSEDLKASFKNSCNTSFSNIGLSLDKAAFRKFCEKMLFNQKLPGDLDTKKSSFSLDASSGTGETMQTAIGQGKTLVSPYHMMLISATIANDGVLMTPYVIDHTQNKDGTLVKQFEAAEYGKLLSKEQAQTIREYMQEVVESGTASALKGQSYTAYGKTGSAEINSNRDSHAWFTGFATKADSGKPDIAIAVIAEEAGTGGKIAAPIAKQVFDAYYAQ